MQNFYFMNNFLNKLITLLELAIGTFLFFTGISGFFSYFIFNVLLSVIGFFVFVDGLSKIDNPPDRNNNEQNNEES